jgi:plastocyanin
MCNAPDVIDEAYITVEAAYFDSSNYSYEVSATLNGSEYTLDTNYDPSFSFPSGTTLTFTKTFSDHPLRLVKCVDFANDSNCIDSAYIFDELTATINSGETFRYYCTSHPLEMGGYITAYD